MHIKLSRDAQGDPESLERVFKGLIGSTVEVTNEAGEVVMGDIAAVGFNEQRERYGLTLSDYEDDSKPTTFVAFWPKMVVTYL